MKNGDKFTEKGLPEIVYEVVGGGWLDKDTFVLVFKEMVDSDGDVYHLEVEYHKDENKFTYTRVYDDEVFNAQDLVTPCFKKQFENYILREIGVIGDGFVTSRSIEVDIKVEVPPTMLVEEFKEWLKNLKINVETNDNKVKILKVENKGNIYN